ncbi:MAG: tyrosine--tRNA ligase [Promethearchaeota archaeon]|jgi:tyrosyl-tRNA synthetase
MSFDLIEQGTAGIFPADELKKKLDSGRVLKIKFGIDPTTPDIHLGHCVALRKLRQFQDLGHKVILIIGEFTASIGDPSGKDKTRPMLDKHDIQENTKTYLEQASKILDTHTDKLEVISNRSWFSRKFSVSDFITDIAKDFTAQQLWHRDSFKRRMEAGVEINLTEFLYPIFQAFDSVMIEADVEIGGTDQTFNLQRGRDLMVKNGLVPQVVITMPLLVGLDGKEKMSKSKSNHVGVMDEPNDMFGKLMSVPDNLTDSYINLLIGNADKFDPHPMGRKMIMAHKIVSMLHDTTLATGAFQEFEKVFRNKKLPTDIEVKHIGSGWHKLTEVIVKVGFAPSKNQARKLIEAGAVRLDGDKVNNGYENEIQLGNGPLILQVGKLRICKLEE